MMVPLNYSFPNVTWMISGLLGIKIGLLCILRAEVEISVTFKPPQMTEKGVSPKQTGDCGDLPFRIQKACFGDVFFDSLCL